VLSEFRRSPPFPGLLRSLPLLRVRDADQAAGWCASFAPHLSTLGIDGFERRADALARAALAAGASRICPLGRMQAPPIEWRHDGVEPLRSLVRLLDREDPREEDHE
jgi:hypothetical protein